MTSPLSGKLWPVYFFYVDILMTWLSRRRIHLRTNMHFRLLAAPGVGVKRKLDMQRSKVWGGYQNSIENLGGTTAFEERGVGEGEREGE